MFRVYFRHFPVFLGNNHLSRICHRFFFHSRSHDRRLRLNARNCLPLHIGTHQRPMRVVMLQKRNQGSCNANRLIWRNIHIVNFVRGNNSRLAFNSRLLFLINKFIIFIQRSAGVSDNRIFFLRGVQINNLVGDFFIFHFPVRGFQKTKLVYSGVRSHMPHQADIRSLGSLNRTNSSIVTAMDIPHFKAGSFPG